MSLAPDQQPDYGEIEPANDRLAPEDTADETDPANQTEQIVPEEGLDDEEEEFSLSQLSQAYAKVLKGVSEPISTPSAPDLENSSKLGDATRIVSGKDSHRTAADTDGIATFVRLVDQDAKDNAGCPITPDSIVEALLFVGVSADFKLTSKKIASYLRDVPPKEIRYIIHRLNERYEREQAVYRIKFLDGAWYLELDEAMQAFQHSYLRKNKGVKLNAATIEVLAIVAYNQPVTRDQVESIRKRPSGSFLNQLVRRELVAEVAAVSKSEPKKYVTTDKFLAFFHLSELKDLPQSHEVADLDELLS
jgi:segregation and condensation protein B